MITCNSDEARYVKNKAKTVPSFFFVSQNTSFDDNFHLMNDNFNFRNILLLHFFSHLCIGKFQLATTSDNDLGISIKYGLVILFKLSFEHLF